MPNTDRVTISHPSAPGETFVVSRRSFASRAKRGWVEVKPAKSPAATAVVPPSPEDNTPNASQEDKKS